MRLPPPLSPLNSGRISLTHNSFLSLPPGSEESPTVNISKENLPLTASKGASTNETFSSMMKKVRPRTSRAASLLQLQR